MTTSSDGAAALPDLPELRATVDDALNVHLPKDTELSEDLLAAMRYATLGNGKRMRPLLTIAAATGCGASLEDALAPACALELIHAYSLIHDDLPAMDDDELRHGLPSCHVRFGEANAILAGDALQALAFETLCGAQGLSQEVRLRSIQVLAAAAGPAGMVGGQARDMEAEKQKLSLGELQRLHAAKTGALMTAAVQIGALVGNASAEQYVLLTEFARRVGLAFQIVDDLLDVTESTEQLGKPAGSDAKAGKNTYPALMGQKASRLRAEELLAEALPMLDRAKIQNPLLGDLAKLSVRRTH
ncbi:MAG: polyprenyl synthetase family protein [Pseudomonadales bacterium]